MERRKLVEYFFVGEKDAIAEKLVFQYPDKAHSPDDYPENILMFMFPCTSAPLSSGLIPPPMYNSFVLTSASGNVLHGASICYFTSTKNDYFSTSLCFVSKWPFYVALLKYLEQLALLGVHECRQFDTFLVEKCLSNLFHEVPTPVRGHAGVIATIGDTDVLFKRYTMQEIPFEMDMEFLEYTFMLLNPTTLVHILCHMLLEHSILIVGVDAIFVTAVAEALRHLIFPLHWDHAFIPVVPLGIDMTTLLDAPVPFLAGGHPLQLEAVQLPPSVVRLDLFEGRITTAMDLPPLPDAALQLIDRLGAVNKKSEPMLLSKRLWERRIAFQKALYSGNHSDLTYERGKFICGSSALIRKISKSFMTMFVDLMSGYEYCKSGNTKAFVSMKPVHAQRFAAEFANTNAFQGFIDSMCDLSSLTKDMQLEAQYFNHCHQQQSHKKSPLLSPQAHHTQFFHAITPEVSPLEIQNDDPTLQHHIGFPKLNIQIIQASRMISLQPNPDESESCVIPNDCSSPKALNSQHTVLQRLDTWLYKSDKGKAMQAIFHRSKTVNLSPRTNTIFHRSLSQPNRVDAKGPFQRPWLKTACLHSCVSRVIQKTKVLEEALYSKTLLEIETAYVELIKAFDVCKNQSHLSDIQHVFKTCLGTAEDIAVIYHRTPYWRPFCQMLCTLLQRGELGETMKWFSQVTLSPQSSHYIHHEEKPAICLEHELESIMHRIYISFSVGSLGVRLSPHNDNKGCQVVGYHESAPRQIRELDIIESINGRIVLQEPFESIVKMLSDAPRPLTLSLLRGMSSVEAIYDGSTPRLRPRRYINDKFGWLFRQNVRVTLLSDCTECGHRLSYNQLESQRTEITCPECHCQLAVHFCVIHNDTPSQPYPYLPWNPLQVQLSALNKISLSALLEMHPILYWNLFVKCLALDIDLDQLFPLSLPKEDKNPLQEEKKDDIQALCQYILSNSSLNDLHYRKLASQILQDNNTNN
ncbi:C-myc promoter-binding protein-like [Thraustotheca clavata]|uniref:C-myc promoter-binding protein-like n=1 Tax=Thraustotheca clavata TaxID=74557 RepID=A0A1V9YLM3_9STRA|nr:C-myc promoter-binding protein-like [Thraustotheca clavata]